VYKMDINWFCNFAPNGYGICGRGYVNILKSLGYNIKVTPYPYMDKSDPLFPLTKVKTKDELFVYHAIPTIPKDCFYTVTEVKRPPDYMAYPLDQAKFIMTQSKFCKESFSRITDSKKIHVVNFPFRAGDMLPTGPKHKVDLGKEFKFVFYTVARVDVRKNLKMLMRAFAEEFQNEQNDVALVMKMGSDRYCIPKMFYDLDLPKNIFWLTDFVDDVSMLYRSFNAYIATDCGEGWGAPTTEAMLCGLPTIAPRHSGHLDYMNDSNSYLIDVGDWEYIGYRKDNLYPDLLAPMLEWKMPAYADIKKKMRMCYEHFKDMSLDDRLQDPIIKNALEVQKIVSYEYVGEQLKQALDWYEDEYGTS